MRRLLTSSLPAYFACSYRVAAFNNNLSSLTALRRLTTANTSSASEDNMTLHANPAHIVDVDCNLLHKDLISMMDTSSFDVDDVPAPLKILHHPSMRSIKAMISPSSTIEESEKSVHLLQSCTSNERNNISIKTTVGVHPYSTVEEAHTPGNLQKLRALIDDSNNNQFISCIGETGLDYSEGFPDKQYQLPWFQSQLDLAFEFALPVFLHERLAFEDTLKCIDEAVERHEGQASPKIIVHCYTGTFLECIEYMKRGYYISVSGYILKQGDNSDEVRKCLREGIIPLERLMIESDAPHMGFLANKDSFFEAEGDAFASLPSKKRKRLKSIYPNTPSSLQLVLEATCNELNIGRKERGEELISLDELASSTTMAATDFFQL
jgi:TatD DNase family protein